MKKDLENVFDALEKIVFPSYNETKQTISNQGATCKLTFREEGANTRCEKFTLTSSLPLSGKNFLVFKFDKKVENSIGVDIEEPFLFLSEEKTVRSKCDFIAFYLHINKKETTLYALLINLKSCNRGNMEDQLNAGEILCKFLLETAIRYQNLKSSSDAEKKISQKLASLNIKYKKIEVLYQPPARKGTTQPHRDSKQLKTHRLSCDKEYALATLLN